MSAKRSKSKKKVSSRSPNKQRGVVRTKLLGLLALGGLSLLLEPYPVTAAPPATENKNSECSDGIDNDGDSLIDCLDSSCDGKSICEFGTETSCSDGDDNDGDGAIDAADTDCAASLGTCPNMPASNPNPPAPLGTTDVINFSAGSIIIPVDVCYQRPDKPTDSSVERALAETYGAGTTISDAACQAQADRDDGVILAYGLIQRLVEDGVPVHWSIKAGKDAWADADFSIVGGGSSPVKHMSRTGTITDPFSSLSTIAYSGAPFIIDEEHADTAKTLINGYGANFDEVDFHVAQVSFDAPIYKTMGSMPKLAVLDLSGYFNNDRSGILQGSIQDVEMDGVEGTWWEYLSGSDVIAGKLDASQYTLVWVPSFSAATYAGSLGFNSDEKTILDEIHQFVADGGSAVVQDEGAMVFEGHGTFDSGTGTYSTELAQPMSAAFAQSDGGFVYNFSSGSFGNNDSDELTASDDYSDPASQWGGATWTGIGGSKYDWTPRCDRSYRDGVRRMVYSNDTASGLENIEFASWKHYNNDTSMGRVYYLGGFNWRKNTHAGFRLQLNTIFVTAGDFVGTDPEVARSAPIVATVGGVEAQYQGTFEANFSPDPVSVYASAADAPNFEFPAVLGHVRALDTSLLVEGNTDLDRALDPDSTSFVDGLSIFDAADVIAGMTTDPSGAGCAIGSGCRHIFTNNSDTKVVLSEDNFEDFKSEFGLAATTTDADKLTLLGLIHAGRGGLPALGGIDRSTLALVEPSPVIGNERPTIAYVGGLDGMMHAICADTVSPCNQLGEELWAFLPRSELANVASNTARIDGSPKVADVLADYGSGTQEFRTVLTFQAGNSHAVYALDVTDPSNPAILWQVSTPGAGLNVALGTVVLETEGLVKAAFIQTSSGTDVSGIYGTAVRMSNGEAIWTMSQDYPDSRSGGIRVPKTGIPGGFTVVASDGGAVVDTVLVPSLWGAVYSLDARTGESKFGTDALFQFSEDFHPIGAPVSVYRDETDQLLRGVIVSGGFADQTAPTSTLWAPDTVNQYAISFPLEPTTTPVLDTAVQSDNSLGVFIDLGPGNRGFSQATIVGGEIFFTTDSEDINASAFGSTGGTGRLYRVNTADGNSSFSTIPSGAAAVDFSTGSNSVFTAGANGVQKTEITDFNASGTSVEAGAVTDSNRFLWLRTQ